MIKNIYDLSGGQNSKVSPLFIKDNECEIVQNYHMDELGALKKRLGTKQLLVGADSQVVDNKDINGIYFFKDIQFSNEDDRSNLLVVCNDNVYTVETGAWDVSDAGTGGTSPSFCTFIDYVFKTNGADAMGSSADPRPTGGSWGTTNCLATLIPKYTCVWEDRVYALNDASATEYPSRIYWSSLPSGAPLAITFTPGTDYADINPDDGDEITWGEPFGSRLLIFKNNALYRWTFGQVEPDKIIDEGTHQGYTVKQIHGICFFANKYGIWAYSGDRPKLISRKVQPFIDAVDSANLTNMRAEVDNDHYYLYIGTVTVNGTSYANAMLAYTISLNAWAVYTFPWAIKSMARAQLHVTSSTFDAIYIGNDDGYVYRFLEPLVYTDRILYNTTKAINGYIRSKEYPLNFPKTSQLKQLYVVAQKALGTKVNYRIDRGEIKPWHDLKERITDGSLVGRARTIQFTFTNNSDDVEPDQLEGFSIEYKPEEKTRK